MKKDMDINIDALLRDTFLTVVELRQGTTVRHGIELYRLATVSGRWNWSANV